MQFDVTRDVVSDLWPLCHSGDASSDSRALVERFLAEDRDFASTLRESTNLRGALPALRLSAEAERRLLDQARERARLKLLVIGGAVAIAGLAILGSLAGVLLLIARGDML